MNLNKDTDIDVDMDTGMVMYMDNDTDMDMGYIRVCVFFRVMDMDLVMDYAHVYGNFFIHVRVCVRFISVSMSIYEFCHSYFNGPVSTHISTC
jgi:hypothetical protein